MVQTIYGLIAIAMVMMLSLNLLRITTGTERQMALNEVATQVTGFAVDVMEHVGNKAFDEATDEDGKNLTIFLNPYKNRSDLTPDIRFGSFLENGKTCDQTDFYHPDCNDIDDFHGMSIDRDIDGIPYTATISVRYVNENDPSLTVDESFAKEITVVITSPYLLIGNTPLQVSLSRVYTYHRITGTVTPP